MDIERLEPTTSSISMRRMPILEIIRQDW